jgi:hypothetical protein
MIVAIQSSFLLLIKKKKKNIAKSHLKLAKLKETVMCDVVPLKLCYILLGRTWIWDDDAYHVVRANTYSFVDRNKKYSME